MRSFLYISILMIVALTGCQKEDEAIVLPAPGPVQQVMAELGSNYDDQVYVSLSKGTMHTVSYRTFDLAFEASPQGRHIYLNGAKYMFLSHTGNADIALADSAGSSWQVDAEHLGDDSTAFGNWWSSASVNSNGCSNVVVVDRGRLDHTGADRFRKIQVIEADDVHYRIRFSNIDNSGLTEMDIPKNPNYSLMYFSFNNGGTMVQQAPPKNDWDFVFTKYTHVYYDEPLTSPFRYYPVTGVIINFWNDVSGSVAKKDSTPDYVPFMDFEYGHVYPMPFTYKADVVGFDWKYYDFGSSQYYIRPDLYFVLKDNQGFYYKLRMVDFYDHSGNKGTVTFEYQRI